MNIYMAPMEGLTGYIYRNAHAKYFGKADKYFTPFISPTMHGSFSPREKRDVCQENNMGLYVVPQILTNNAEYFIHTAAVLGDMGYQEVNLNLGCPSKTVVTKGKGSGFLSDIDLLNCFLERIFTETKLPISIKTRIGVDSAEDHMLLMALFNRYPLEELIIHPRIQKDFYKNIPNLEVFEMMSGSAKMPVCYNGDLCTMEDVNRIKTKFPTIDRIMIGREFIKNPNFIREIRGEEMKQKEQVKRFLDEILEGYRQAMENDRNALFRMKEIWSYFGQSFPENKKAEKQLKKSQTLVEYQNAVDLFFGEQTK